MSQLPKVGQNLRRLRNGLGLSLDEASKLTSVSKAMLGQIERGESSPTISTLWKISSGLKVNFTSLIDDNQNELVLVKKENIKVVHEEKGQMRLYPIFPFDSKNGVDVFLVELDAGGKHISTTHKNVLEEMVLVVEGTLTIDVEQEVYELKAGDSLKFDGESNHTYMNKGNKKVVFHNIEIYK
ncbi:helix-turn-helix domain-containing protein [Intestinibacter sp.]